jgi:hypothetical protein
VGFKNCYHQLLKNVMTKANNFFLYWAETFFSNLVNIGIIYLAKTAFNEVANFYVCGHVDR